MFDFREYGDGIFAFDAGYVRPILAAIHIVVENGRAALIDTGSNDSLPNTLEALARIGVAPEAVDYVVLTHIHLDHAGGAGTMMRAFPNARLVVHPRGARHMAEPSKLVAGVTAVYGEAYMQRVYGEILPVPAERILEAPEGYTFALSGRVFECMDTPGHAKHHMCIIDQRTGGIFTGDMFGLSYRELDVDGRKFIFPTTSPSQFDQGDMRASVQRLLDLQPPCLYLTHYGRLEAVAECGQALLKRLDATVNIALALRAQPPETRHAEIKAGISRYLLDEARAHGCTLPEVTLLEIWETDLELNAQGLAIWMDSAAA